MLLLTQPDSRYPFGVYVASVTEEEIKLTIDAAFEFANALLDDDLDVRALLVSTGFSGTETASDAAMRRVGQRCRDLLDFLIALPDAGVDDAVDRINSELAELPIQPAIVDHDGAGHHIHWTPQSARFDDKVLADILMALAHEVCDNGTIRFGRCAADDCDHLFYDATRNRSRRFCSDPRCASRTHTADHRARKRRRGGKI